MTITATDTATGIVYTMETEEDLRTFFAGMSIDKWAICEECGKAFRGNVHNQKYCPALPPAKKSRCSARASNRRYLL